MSVLLPDELQAIQQWTENAIRAIEQRADDRVREVQDQMRVVQDQMREVEALASFAERNAKALRLVAMNGDLRDLPPEDAPRDQWERLFAKYRV